MIKVTYTRKGYCRVQIEGHAQSAEPGHDLICAAASMLAYTLAVNVNSLKAAGHVKNTTVRLENGDSDIRCTPKVHFKSVICVVFDSICAGFELLSKQYPQNISYEIRE